VTPAEELAAWIALYWIVVAVVAILGLVIAYFVIRLAIAHGLRQHQRWLDNGKI
jgi:high-affinity Fe2+/Pb2+ permease